MNSIRDLTRDSYYAAQRPLFSGRCSAAFRGYVHSAPFSAFQGAPSLSASRACRAHSIASSGTDACRLQVQTKASMSPSPRIRPASHRRSSIYITYVYAPVYNNNHNNNHNHNNSNKIYKKKNNNNDKR